MIPEGYFRFSKYVHSRSALSAWAEWFSARGIPYVFEIRETDREIPHSFALWRKGREKLSPDTKSNR
jgi:hypothetical protein